METLLENTSKHDQRIARLFMAHLREMSALHITSRDVEVTLPGKDLTLKIPAKAFSLLVRILGNMAEGKSNAVFPSNKMLSTQQAADILNISRPYLVKLLEADEIPYIKAGTHRRIELKHILEYKEKMKNSRRKNLDYLAKQSQNLNLGY